METWLFVVPGALIALGALVVHTLSLRPSRMSHVVLGLVLFAACLVINSQGIYLAVDPLLPGANLLYLAVQITWVLSMAQLWSAFVPFKRHGILAWQNIALLVTLMAVSVLFFLTPATATEYRMASSRGFATAIAFTQLVNLYSVVAATGIVRSLWKVLRHGAHDTKLDRLGYAVTAAGFAVGIVTFLWRIFVATAYLTLDSSALAVANNVDGILVGITAAGIATGLLMLITSSGMSRPVTVNA